MAVAGKPISRKEIVSVGTSGGLLLSMSPAPTERVRDGWPKMTAITNRGFMTDKDDRDA